MNVFLYIDPTTGGMALQIILGGLVGGLVAVKMFWHNLTSIFRRKSADPADDEQESPTSLSPDAAADYKIDSPTS